MQTHEMKVDMFSLLTMAAKDLKSPTMSIGFMQIHNRMRKIAQRAVELDDKELLHELECLGVVTITEKKHTPMLGNKWDYTLPAYLKDIVGADLSQLSDEKLEKNLKLIQLQLTETKKQVEAYKEKFGFLPSEDHSITIGITRLQAMEKEHIYERVRRFSKEKKA